jgi:hypothetical protein
MIYEHINGVAVIAQFSFENDSHYRYRLENNFISELVRHAGLIFWLIAK